MVCKWLSPATSKREHRPIRFSATIGIVAVVAVVSGCSGKCGAQDNDRVAQARRHQQEAILRQFNEARLSYPPGSLFLRIFKLEGTVELWAADHSDTAYTHVKDYRVTWPQMPGILGPKRQQGDYQVPEGYYRIVDFNPYSAYHLSMRIDYPNKSDLIRKHGPDPGGDIFIHGSNVTIGCVPIGDEAIEELYVIAWDAKQHGAKEVPVHIFPCRMDRLGCTEMLDSLCKTDKELRSFWDELREGYLEFEHAKLPSPMKNDKMDRYPVPGP